MDKIKTTIILTDPERTPWTLSPTGEFGEGEYEGQACFAELVFDGAVRGVWTVNAVVELARELGWDGVDSQEDIEASGDGPVVLVATSFDAEQYLNEIVPPGWGFGWSDGDFFLANDAWWSIDG